MEVPLNRSNLVHFFTNTCVVCVEAPVKDFLLDAIGNREAQTPMDLMP